MISRPTQKEKRCADQQKHDEDGIKIFSVYHCCEGKKQSFFDTMDVLFAKRRKLPGGEKFAAGGLPA